MQESISDEGDPSKQTSSANGVFAQQASLQEVQMNRDDSRASAAFIAETARALVKQEYDKLLTLFSVDLDEAALCAGDRKFLKRYPQETIPLADIRHNAPQPAYPNGCSLIDEMEKAIRDSAGDEAYRAAEDFRSQFGVHYLVETYRLIGMAICNDPRLIDEQIQLIEAIEAHAAGIALDRLADVEAPGWLQSRLLRLLAVNRYHLATWRLLHGQWAEALEDDRRRLPFDLSDDSHADEMRLAALGACALLAREQSTAERVLRFTDPHARKRVGRALEIFVLRVPDLQQKFTKRGSQ
jgi:hypothetical protein